jgi:hypothetical protein
MQEEGKERQLVEKQQKKAVHAEEKSVQGQHARRPK